MKSPIILALDTKDLDLAGKWISAASEYVDHFKIGLEFYLKHHHFLYDLFFLTDVYNA